MNIELGHSPLGASGSHRWIACPPSVKLAAGNEGIDHEDDTFSLPGNAAHAVVARCLETSRDAWEFVGYYYDGQDGIRDVADVPAGSLMIDAPMANACQLYLNAVRREHPEFNQGNAWIERFFHAPRLHPSFYGRTDFGFADWEGRVLHVWDFKFGAGIVVEPKENPQGMYYACGLLESLGAWDKFDKVVIHIHQPRIDWLPAHRTWEISISDLSMWLFGTLIPAMLATENAKPGDAVVGEHCRFCPVRFLDCPGMAKMEARLRYFVEQLLKKDEAAKKLTPEQAGEWGKLMIVARIRDKAVGKVQYGYLMAGKTVPGFKLGKAKANREWKEDRDPKTGQNYEEAAIAQFGEQAYNPKAIKSPAQIEDLPGGDAFAARWAQKPQKGLKVVPIEDSRPAIVQRKAKDTFQPIQKGK